MQSQRVLKLNDAPTNSGKCVVYVMARDQRVADNHALLYAQQQALTHRLPLVVVFALHSSGVRQASQYRFMVEGLRQVQQQLAALNISFHLILGPPRQALPRFMDAMQPQLVVFDFNPLRGPRALQKSIASSLGVNCMVVDTHNIVPLWLTSDKEEFAAHTIRLKLHRQLGEWLQTPEKMVKHPHGTAQPNTTDWAAANALIADLPSTDQTIEYPTGETSAQKTLEQFIDGGLGSYATQRNIPTSHGQSGLSPYLHFGQLSALRVALELLKVSDDEPLLLREPRLASAGDPPSRMDSINALLEELIVRKELADNYCFYNANYDNYAGAKDWARQSLELHRTDVRDHTYARAEWEAATTHDAAWNAAQLQMMRSGKMHGYMRMYWAKKLLEWSATPEEAIAIAVYLNDKYSIDGGDPNGYTGIMWSIAGIHDRPWFDRHVYGKIRYMNLSGLQKRFDVAAYIRQWTA